MAMNLRLTPEQSAGLRAAAEQRLSDAIARVATEDAELLDRLSK